MCCYPPLQGRQPMAAMADYIYTDAVDIYVHRYIHIYIYICTYTCAHMCIHICMYVYMCI